MRVVGWLANGYYLIRVDYIVADYVWDVDQVELISRSNLTPGRQMGSRFRVDAWLGIMRGNVQ